MLIWHFVMPTQGLLVSLKNFLHWKNWLSFCFVRSNFTSTVFATAYWSFIGLVTVLNYCSQMTNLLQLKISIV